MLGFINNRGFKSRFSGFLVSLSIAGVFFWVQIYANRAILDFGASLFSPFNSGAGLWGAEQLISGLRNNSALMSEIQSPGFSEFFGSASSFDVSGFYSWFSNFWGSWGLIISAALFILGILLSAKPLKTLAISSAVVAALVIILPRLLAWFMEWAIQNNFGGDWLHTFAPSIYLANEALISITIPAVIACLIVFVVAMLLQIILGKNRSKLTKTEL